MPVVLAIVRVPAVLGLLVAVLLMIGCGPGTARQVAVDPVRLTTYASSSDQQAVAVVEPAKPRPIVEAPAPQPQLFADEQAELEPYETGSFVALTSFDITLCHADG